MGAALPYRRIQIKKCRTNERNFLKTYHYNTTAITITDKIPWISRLKSEEKQNA